MSEQAAASPRFFKDEVIAITYRVGVDVGGTFTDLLLLEPATGAALRTRCLAATRLPAPKPPGRAAAASLTQARRCS